VLALEIGKSKDMIVLIKNTKFMRNYCNFLHF